MKNKVKKILILYTPDDENGRVPVLGSEKNGLERFFRKGRVHGIEFYRASLDWFDKDKKQFAKAWSFADDKWSILTSIKPDIVFDKCQYANEFIRTKNEIASSFKYVNDPIFDEIISNKFITYSLFKEFMSRSYLVYSKDDMVRKMNCLKGDYVVLKTVIGSKGKGVKIMTKKEALASNVKKVYILQEFVDSSRGVKDLVIGYHDLRVIIFNKKIFGAYLRLPQEGSLLANVAQGGRRMIIQKKEIPPEVLRISNKIIETFSQFNDVFYSADFILGKNQKPYLIEINSRPGFLSDDNNSRKFFDKYTDEVIRYLLGIK